MQTIVQIYRIAHPRSRRTRATAITHSGSNRTAYGCVCGSWHTVATRNRGTTRHERVWMAEHALCMVEPIAQRAALLYTPVADVFDN